MKLGGFARYAPLMCLLFCAVAAHGENHNSFETKLLKINESSSFLTIFPSDPLIIFPDQPPLGPVSFGGILELQHAEYFIDTLYHDGSPRDPVTLESIAVKLIEMSVSSDIMPLDFYPQTRTFTLNAQLISGDLFDTCEPARAAGTSCSSFEFFLGTPDYLEGSYDGEVLLLRGRFRQDIDDVPFDFFLEARPVPLPASVMLLASGIAPLLLRCRARG